MGGNIDLSQLNLYNIDHIEMVEGSDVCYIWQ
ncbi:MAG: hypothetical protein R2744_11325 [Bacteroidales bacterium]